MGKGKFVGRVVMCINGYHNGAIGTVVGGTDDGTVDDEIFRVQVEGKDKELMPYAPNHPSPQCKYIDEISLTTPVFEVW